MWNTTTYTTDAVYRPCRQSTDIIKDTIRRLKQNGVLDSTYLIYSIDNGFYIGQHLLQPGKHIVSRKLGWAGANIPKELDSQAIRMNGDKLGSEHWEHTQIEHWGDAGFDGRFEKQ
ncbi:MAG: hypothetical protein LQ337_007541 [Flavoplaca oasis]|nr:MAG: hypothetical protein LQ337_007541 [Flavoplaca oasis]